MGGVDYPFHIGGCKDCFWWGGEEVCFGDIEGWEVRDGGRKFF